MSRARRQRRSFARRGVALVVALVVVLLITTFLSQFSFTTSLELRSLQAQKETMQARALARAVFKAVQGALLQDESDFLFGYKQLKQVLGVTAIAWEEGLLTALEIEPLDPLFNLNRLARIQPDSPQDVLLHELFQKALGDVLPLAEKGNPLVQPIEPAALSGLYSAVFDWIDQDETVYTAIPGAVGAEAAEYFGERPERAPPNRPLERLSEIRLVRGVADSRIPWEIWRSRFSIREPSAGESNLYPGLLNVNGATRDQIVAFLEARRVEDSITDALPGSLTDIQKALNEYAKNAEEIVQELIPEESLALVLPRSLTQSDIQGRLKQLGLKPLQSTQVFSTFDEYFRVRIVTQVGQMQAELEAVLHTPRNAKDRTAYRADVLEYTLR
jgi:type II secretory pathway component PulK